VQNCHRHPARMCRRRGLGSDRYEGLGGADIVSGLVSELDGDVIEDFDAEDGVFITEFSGDVLVVETGTGVDLVLESATLSLNGDFSQENFEINALGGSTFVQLADAGATQLSEAGERFITTDTGDNRVFGDSGDDVIATADGSDTASGGAGADVVLAGPGADILIGGLGADRLTGGEGADIFSFDASDFEDGVVTADFITDFEIGVDQIELTGFGFSGLGGLVFTDVGLAISDANSLWFPLARATS